MLMARMFVVRVFHFFDVWLLDFMSGSFSGCKVMELGAAVFSVAYKEVWRGPLSCLPMSASLLPLFPAIILAFYLQAFLLGIPFGIFSCSRMSRRQNSSDTGLKKEEVFYSARSIGTLTFSMYFFFIILWVKFPKTAVSFKISPLPTTCYAFSCFSDLHSSQHHLTQYVLFCVCTTTQ